MRDHVQEYLVVPRPLPDAERALDVVVSERGFDRADLPAPHPADAIARAEMRFFDAHAIGEAVTLIREWHAYRDAVTWSAALELAEGLPPAARMEMALPPALSILTRALSRDDVAVGVATRASPRQIVAVAFQRGRAADVLTVAGGRIALGPSGAPRTVADSELGGDVRAWLARHTPAADAADVILGIRSLPPSWRLAYLHRDAEDVAVASRRR